MAEDQANAPQEESNVEPAEAPEAPEAPKAEAPEAEAPAAEAPEAPKAEAPAAEAPEAEAPEAPKAEAPEAEAPEAPKSEAPAAEAPEAPKVKAPKAKPKAPKAPAAEAPEAAKAEAPEAPTAEAPEAPPAEADSKPAPQLAPGKQYVWGTGRRKSAVARVRIRPGTGKFIVNKREATAYFVHEEHRQSILGPLEAAKMLKSWDVFVNVGGGGYGGQAGAVVMGLARALSKAVPEVDQALRDQGMMTRDARMKERKKYGQRGARARFQFSKR